MMMNTLVLLFCNFVIGTHTSMEFPDHFFPVPKTLNTETFEPIYLKANFTLFGKTTNYVVVSENGLISYPKGKIEAFPRTVKKGTFLSIFWTDNFPQFGKGNIYYGEYNNPEMLTRAKIQINAVFQCEEDFEPESVFVATWHNVRTRFACVQKHSVEFCDCLASDDHWGDMDFCECRKEHSKQYCERCMGDFPEDDRSCTCLDETDNYEYCRCEQSTPGECTCLKDHDAIYCDCLSTSNSQQQAWNCSCLQKYSSQYCYCLLTSDENHDYCRCQNERGSNCGCYLVRSKFFCDCFRLGKTANEGYCDCMEQGNDFTLCTCIHELHATFFSDSNMIKTYCECVAYRYGIDEWATKLPSSYCTCAAQQDPSTCEEDDEDTKRDALPTRLEYAQQHGLVKPEGSTYQAVLISGGGRSFVIYNYGYFSSDIEKASINNLRLSHNVALLTVEDPYPVKYKHYTLTYGRGFSAKDPWFLLKGSNSGTPGQYMFRTDQFPLEQPDCSTKGQTYM